MQLNISDVLSIKSPNEVWFKIHDYGSIIPCNSQSSLNNDNNNLTNNNNNIIPVTMIIHGKVKLIINLQR